MIITNCAACAAPLAYDAPRCVRCKTRYCNSTCQHDHWRRGHKQICKKIHRGGNAEQYHADKNIRRPSRSRSRSARTTRRGRRATSARRPSTGKQRRVSCADARAAGRRALCTSRAWRSRRRFWSRRARRTIWMTTGLCRGGIGGTRAAYASKSTTESWRARSGGRAGRRTWGGRRPSRRTKLYFWQ